MCARKIHALIHALILSFPIFVTFREYIKKWEIPFIAIKQSPYGSAPHPMTQTGKQRRHYIKGHKLDPGMGSKDWLAEVAKSNVANSRLS